MHNHQGTYLLALLVLLLVAAMAGVAWCAEPDETEPPGELVPVDFEVKGDGHIEVMSLQRKENVYLAVQTIFDFLRIRNTYDPVAGTLSGFFVSPDTPYVVNIKDLTARVGRRKVALADHDIATRGDTLYFHVDMFEHVFGLSVKYSPRQLRATLYTEIQLPAFLARRIKRMEEELASRPPKSKPEAVFEPKFTYLDGGSLDYSIQQTLSEGRIPTRFFSGSLAGILLGGDARVQTVGSLAQPVDLVQTRARWRYVPNEGAFVKQIVVGDLTTTTGLMASEIYGLQLTNRPANPRTVFADVPYAGPTYTRTGVYLFEGPRLLSIQRPAGGQYDFHPTLRYGVTSLDIMEFGEWGERYGSSYRVVVPTNMVPPGDLDYEVTSGRMRRPGDPWYTIASTQWGISSRVTATMQTEYYGMNDLSTNVFPTVGLITRLSSHLIGQGLISPNAEINGNLSLTLPSLVGASFSYTAYRPVRLFNPREALNEMTGDVVLPFSTNGDRFAFSLSGTQTILHHTRERRLEAGLGAFMGIFSPSLRTQYSWSYAYDGDHAGVTSVVFHQTEASVLARLPANLFVSVAVPYDHLAGRVSSLRFNAFLRPLPDLEVEFTYGRTFEPQSTVARLGIRYTAPFVRATAGGSTGQGGAVVFDQGVSGSVSVIPREGQWIFGNNPIQTGYASFLVEPFVDNNGNGVRDEGEPIILTSMVSASLSGERGVRLTDIPDVGWTYPKAVAYQDYIVSIPQLGLDNPLWVPRYKAVDAKGPPGVYTYVPIPVVTGGAIRGTVALLKGPNESEGIEYAKVLLREDTPEEDLLRLGRTRREVTVETFSTGDYEFLSIPPGQYTVMLDTMRLATLGMTARRLTRSVTVVQKPEGDVIEGVNFVVVEKEMLYGKKKVKMN